MAHRADLIVDAVVTAVTGLTTTGTRVERGRTYNVEVDGAPALSVYMGADTPLGAYGMQNMGFIDSDLSVRIRIYVQSVSTQVDSLLSTIRREIHVALAAAGTLSLSYVQMVYCSGADEPIIAVEGDQPIAVMDTNWVVRYRAPVSDPGG